MDLEKLKEKPLFQLTAREFLDLQANHVNEKITPKKQESSNTKKYVYGIRGIAKLLHCSISTANRIKKSGKINEAIIQNGRLIIVDAELALKLIKETN